MSRGCLTTSMVSGLCLGVLRWVFGGFHQQKWTRWDIYKKLGQNRWTLVRILIKPFWKPQNILQKPLKGSNTLSTTHWVTIDTLPSTSRHQRTLPNIFQGQKGPNRSNLGLPDAFQTPVMNYVSSPCGALIWVSVKLRHLVKGMLIPSIHLLDSI